MARFHLLYERFREILALNDSTLQLIADLEELRARRAPEALVALAPRIRRVAMDVFLMVKDLNQIADGRYPELYQVLKNLNAQIEGELGAEAPTLLGPVVLRLDTLRLLDAPLAGTKMATLGELRASGRWAVPNGFAISTSAFSQFMTETDLWTRVERLDTVAAMQSPAALTEASREVASAVMRAPVPEGVARPIFEAYDAMARSNALRVAMRSSAVGEDTSLSHAGQYHTELNVERHGLLDAYRLVVASGYGPSAVSYRLAHGLHARDISMAVGCMRMLAPRVSGILYSRAFEKPERDVVVVSATTGIAAGVVAGIQTAVELRFVEGQPARSAILSEAECLELIRLARDLESWRGQPQDIEWAIDKKGRLFVLQARPLTLPRTGTDSGTDVAANEAPLAAGGQMACPGTAAGCVAPVRSEDDLNSFPERGVLVARHSSPQFARVMERCAAVVTEVGSPSGHMAILAREYQVPTIVGLPRALELLAPGAWVTVDATTCRIFAGRLVPDAPPRPARAPEDTAGLHSLDRLVALVTPLHLTNPTSPHFTAASCRSLHDVTRFVHEKIFEVMFHFGDRAARNQQNAFTLAAHLPIHVLLYDVGGGVSPSALPAGRLPVEDVISIPGRAFLSGLSDPRIRWDQPRALSGRGFLSVMGAGIAGPPPEAQQVGRHSYAVLSDRYMNFSTKAGYHFSTVDTYCGASLNKNYIHFRFERGGAQGDRRARRVRFLSHVLRALDFATQPQGDVLIARLEKYDRDTICARLVDLGRLTLCSRQLDMLMDNDDSVDFFAEKFLAGDFSVF